MSDPNRSSSFLKADPLQALVAVIMALMTTSALNEASIWFAPILFVVSIGGMAVVVKARLRALRIQREGERAVDYQKLANIDTDKLLPWLKDNVRGHDQVIDLIFQHLKKSAQLARPGRTLGNFLLVGPTGTGKAFLSQLVGQGLFPDSEVVHLAMNQYRQPGDERSLIGSPPGTPGSDAGGRLTRPTLENPYRVIVLSELEKAHHDVQECLYDILDTGTCREKNTGRLVDFSGCVFFGTCNVGVEKLRGLTQELGSTTSPGWLGRSRDALAEAAKFDRAFLSRWDGVFLMDTLPPLCVAEVACMQLQSYWREYGIDVGYVAPQLIAEVVQRNQDFAEYGVGQLGRIVRDKTEHAILDAKRHGSKKVSLNVPDETGQLQVEVL
jgi:ATP-dependent Clp protease ATP-binding subunit ClpA